MTSPVHRPAKGSRHRREPEVDAEPLSPSARGFGVGPPGGTRDSEGADAFIATPHSLSPSRRSAEALLEEAPEGRAALEDLSTLEREHGVRLVEEPLEGCNGIFDPSSGSLTIDPTKRATPQSYVHTWVHEGTHASQTHGLSPARDGLRRGWSSFDNAAAYAAHMVELEARAEARSIEVLEALGLPLGTRLEAIHQKAYAEAAGEPSQRREAAVQAMTQAILRGEEWAYLGPRSEAFWVARNAS